MKKKNKTGYKSNRCSACNCRADNHKTTCVFVLGTERIDFVKCIMCGYKARSLGQHVRKSHNLLPEKYQGQLLANTAETAYSKGNSGRDNWVKMMKINNPQLLTLMLKNMAEKVSASVLADPDEIARRSETMKNLWKKHDAFFRKVASETAKETSSRQDVLDKRTEVLRRWREENPQIFYERCTAQMVKMKSSRPEKALAAWLIENYSHLGFKHSQRLFNKDFTTVSRQRLIDVLSKEHKIVVEFDGPVHFKNIPSWNQLEEVQHRDNEVNEVLNGEYTVIRVSHDQWHPTQGFGATCLETLQMVLEDPGSYRNKTTKIGWCYEELALKQNAQALSSMHTMSRVN